MTHRIAAVIVNGDIDAEIARQFDMKILALPQGLSLIALDPAYCDHWAVELQMPGFISERPQLNCRVVHHMVRAISPRCRFAVLETEYFGGIGEQCAVVYEGTATLMEPREADAGPINEALRLLGLKAASGRDEFETAGLGRWRNFDDLFAAYHSAVGSDA
jgi:hypothetical protein